MIIDLRAVRAVVLAGTGSDDDYITRAFGGPLRDAGATLLAPPPQPTRLIDGYLSGLDDAAREGPIVVGGVSIGAAVAVAWALRHPQRTVAVLAALPAWTGAPGSSPAAIAARYSAQRLREDGLITRAAATADGSPAAVEQTQRETMTAEGVDERDFCLVEFPARGQEATILIAVGVTQHHLLCATTTF